MTKITAMVKLGKKYHFRYLTLDALEIFRNQFPQSLLEFNHQGKHVESWVLHNARAILKLADSEAALRHVLPITYFILLSSTSTKGNNVSAHLSHSRSKCN